MKKFALLLSMAALVFASCEKDDENTTTTPTTGPAALALNFEAKAGADNLVFNQPYTNDLNQNFTWKMAQFYVSDVKLWADRTGTNTVELPDSYFLINPDNGQADLGMIPSGTYYGVEFVVGIADSATNHGDPALAEGVLAPQNPSMHWSWNSGYIFIRIEGDYAQTQGGAPDTHFEFHIGMDNLAQEVTIAKEFTVEYGANNVTPIIVDHKAILTGVDFTTDTVTHTMDNMMLAMRIANNIPNSFK